MGLQHLVNFKEQSQHDVVQEVLVTLLSVAVKHVLLDTLQALIYYSVGSVSGTSLSSYPVKLASLLDTDAFLDHEILYSVLHSTHFSSDGEKK